MKSTSLKCHYKRTFLAVISIVQTIDHYVLAMNVVQWQDSMQIMPNHYLDLYNFNDATLITDKEAALK